MSPTLADCGPVMRIDKADAKTRDETHPSATIRSALSARKQARMSAAMVARQLTWMLLADRGGTSPSRQTSVWPIGDAAGELDRTDKPRGGAKDNFTSRASRSPALTTSTR